MIAKGRTTVPLHLDATASVFVVFRRAANEPSRSFSTASRSTVATIGGAWTVTFPPGWGAPPGVRFDSLASWTSSSDEGVKYFSGSATYVKDLDAPQEWFRPGARIVIDLGAVKEIAEVSVNGVPLGEVLWKPPYAADITSAIKQGRNRIELKVTNLWVNRIVGDAQPKATKRSTFFVFPHFSQ